MKVTYNAGNIFEDNIVEFVRKILKVTFFMYQDIVYDTAKTDLSKMNIIFLIAAKD